MDDARNRINLDTGIMDVHYVARYLRLSEADVYKLACRGILPAFRTGKLWRFHREIIDDWIRKETQTSIRVPE
jgi:excisionase family DNA binding protein